MFINYIKQAFVCTICTVKNFTLPDVQGYYDNNMTSENASVVIVGDVQQNEILPKLNDLKYIFYNGKPKEEIVEVLAKNEKIVNITTYEDVVHLGKERPFHRKKANP